MPVGRTLVWVCFRACVYVCVRDKFFRLSLTPSSLSPLCVGERVGRTDEPVLSGPLRVLTSPVSRRLDSLYSIDLEFLPWTTLDLW